MMLPAAMRSELESRVASAITNREAAVDVMKAIQNHYGWLTDEGVVEAAQILQLSPLQVEELASFYEMIYRRPVGRRVIHICDSISCWSRGMESLMDHVSKLLGVAPGQTTADGVFTLLPCACLGNCGDGPMMMIGEALFGNVTPEKLEEIIASERSSLTGSR